MENRGRTDNTMAKRTRGQTTIYKARHRKLKLVQPQGKPGVNSGDPEG